MLHPASRARSAQTLRVWYNALDQANLVPGVVEAILRQEQVAAQSISEAQACVVQ